MGAKGSKVYHYTLPNTIYDEKMQHNARGRLRGIRDSLKVGHLYRIGIENEHNDYTLVSKQKEYGVFQTKYGYNTCIMYHDLMRSNYREKRKDDLV